MVMKSNFPVSSKGKAGLEEEPTSSTAPTGASSGSTFMDGSSSSADNHGLRAKGPRLPGKSMATSLYPSTPPLLLQRGMFGGKHMKFLLTVEQEAVSGRRTTEKDRRPLGPSPIVRLRAVECLPKTGGREFVQEEVDYSEVEATNLVCAASFCRPEPQSSRPTRPASSHPSSDLEHSGISKNPGGAGPGPPTRFGAGHEGLIDGTAVSNPGPSEDGHAESLDPISKSIPAGPEPEARNLHGGLHVGGIKIPDLQGQPGLWFIFTDLCVRQEGVYLLKFRCFDLTAVKNGGPPAAHLAECRSQPFQVYLPRQVPMLPKHTALAEHFGKLGYKLNTRKNDRMAHVTPPPFASPEGASEVSDRPNPHPIQPSDPSAQLSSSSTVDRDSSSTMSHGAGSNNSDSAGKIPMDLAGRSSSSRMSQSEAKRRK